MTEIIKINDNTWRFEEEGVRFFLLCGTEKAFLVDTGMNSPNARELAESVTDLPITLINTHSDKDHISGNGSFDKILMCPTEEARYRSFGGEGEIVPVLEGNTFDLGGRTLEIIEIPGHTPGSIAILDVENRVLLSGDSVQDGNIFMFSEGRVMQVYVQSLKHLLEYDTRYDVIYPCHGTFPVYPDLTPELLRASISILSGEAKWQPYEVFGKPVRYYKFPFAGYYCDAQ